MHYLDFNEAQTHGTTDFPIGYYLVDEAHPRYNMPYHWHQEYEIIRISTGNLTIYLGNEEITAREGDVIFVNSGMVHGGIPHSCVYECIVFDLNALAMYSGIFRSQLRQITKNKLEFQNYYPAATDALHKVVYHLLSAFKSSKTGYELLVIGSLFEFFGIVFQNEYYRNAPHGSSQNQKKLSQLKSVLEHIETSYTHPITLEDLSKIAGMSSKYFCRFFHTAVHMTPLNYLTYYRVECACFLLATQNLSVTEVGLSCGFNDISYFIKCFKKHKGITPKQYALQMEGIR